MHNLYKFETCHMNMKTVNFVMVEAYWNIGKQIAEAQDNNPRAEYGAQL